MSAAAYQGHPAALSIVSEDYKEIQQEYEDVLFKIAVLKGETEAQMEFSNMQSIEFGNPEDPEDSIYLALLEIFSESGNERAGRLLENLIECPEAFVEGR